MHAFSSAPEDLIVALDAAVAQATQDAWVSRLWAKDASLWTGGDEAEWLGWLDLPDQVNDFTVIAGEVDAFARRNGIRHVLLLGMGGSSLCPDVMRLILGRDGSGLALTVLDSTDPGQIAAVHEALDLEHLLVIAASKSGSTLEPDVLLEYFWAAMKLIHGARVGSHFVAITDPGSKLEQLARERSFGKIVSGLPSVGGRFSALSPFGLVPASLLGVDLGSYVQRVQKMATACRVTDAASNPGAWLGIALGVCAESGRDKLTLSMSDQLAPLGVWLEQLIAESTGKLGHVILPIESEALASPEHYSTDRVFVDIRERGAAPPAALEALEKAGFPVIRIQVQDTLDLGAEFLRWEVATAFAGMVLGINPFDQPDVEAAKVAARRMMDAYVATGALPQTKPDAADGALTLWCDATGSGLEERLAHFLARIHAGDYLSFCAFLPMNSETQATLKDIRMKCRDRIHVPTSVGFGPRFLHSTGQAHKGGPNSGVFLQITCDDARDLKVPGRPYSFGTIKSAQAAGDFEVLRERGRRIARVHLAGDLATGLSAFSRAMDTVTQRVRAGGGVS